MEIDTKNMGLVRAQPHDRPLLENLLELYIHDLSEVFSIQIGDDGRFGYPHLSTYWSEPDKRFAYVIRAGSAIAGFAFAKIGSPLGSEPDDLDVAEFFVLRNLRRNGVGRAAAFLLWDKLPGHWVVRVSEGNRGGLAFWSEAVAAYTKGEFSVRDAPGTPHGWRVFRFARPRG
jgi:predicted acetyltransferase